MMVTALHHVLVAMPSGREDIAREFYRDILGMQEVTKPPALAAKGGAWFRSGSAELHLGIEEPFRPAEKAHPAFVVSDLDDVVDRLVVTGRSVIPDDEFPGHRRVYVRDPFGNRIELLEPVPLMAQEADG